MNKIWHYGAFLLLVGMLACSGKGGDNTNLSHTEKVKLEQYLVSGRELYIRHCSNCHQPDGQGLSKLFPPLKGSDYVDENMEKVPCIIRYGMSGPVIVNGVTYNQPMPPMPQLTALEIAEITTFLYNNWGRQHGMINVREVEKILENCNQ